MKCQEGTADRMNCRAQSTRFAGNSTGFTLIEVLIAMTILVIITGTVYASFSSVVSSVETTRVFAEEMRLRQFLQRSFNTNFSTAYVNGDNEAYNSQFFQFVGVNGTDSHGHADSVRFVSSAPIVGGGALPGDLKEVKYEILSSEDESQKLFDDDEDQAQPEDEQLSFRDHMLQCLETPIQQGNVQSLDSGASDTTAVQADDSYIAPMWTVPIQSFDILFFDGQEWLEEWDSEAVGHMPWAVHIRIAFAKPEAMREADKEAGFNVNDDPDIELIIPVPPGIGVTLDQRDFQESTGDDGAVAGSGGEGSGGSGEGSGGGGEGSGGGGQGSGGSGGGSGGRRGDASP
jgi:prepilin-type N-terminal cleavage/methylation domain-containing protein